MKKMYPFLFTLLLLIISNTSAQKHVASGDKFIRGNRLISVRSIPGSQLHRSSEPVSILPVEIQIDGRRTEKFWEKTQILSPFITETGETDPAHVYILQDKSHIYLFWEIEEKNGIIANVNTRDSVLTADTYIQINLQPLLPDSIKFARNYYYSIVINPLGTVWDSYFDPYLGGYFFSSWNSNIKVKTIVDRERWTAEMKIPFSGLDHYSDPGWHWQLQLYHVSQNEAGKAPQVYGLPTGITVQQGIMVRRPQLVQYYWTRPEFMEEVKPPKRSGKSKPISVTRLTNLPDQNDMMDKDLWDQIEAIQILFDDSKGKPLNENTARFKAGIVDNYLCLNLQADGAKTWRMDSTSLAEGRGMKGQTVGVNGVFVDDALFASECFWILIQPRDPAADCFHQNFYLITINNTGEVGGISYDQFGTPDRNWRPTVLLDAYDSITGWGAEVSIDVSSFDLPVELGETWGLNIFRNRLIVSDSRDSELQAWLYTVGEFLNPETMGKATNIRFDDDQVIQAGLKRKAEKLKEIFSSYNEEYRKFIIPLQTQLLKLGFETKEELISAQKMIEAVDHSFGIIDAKKYFASYPHLTKGGYALLDVQFIGKYGWAVGAMGTILRTEDRGVTWQSIQIDTDVDFYRVQFVNKNEGWIAGGRIRMGRTNEEMRHDERGGYGYIFHTTDGGKSWHCQYGERGRHIFGLCFIDSKTGFACGELGFLLRTDDGGKHWFLSPNTGTNKWLYGIAFTDKLNGVIVGESETVLRTRDGGKSWEKIHAPADRKFYGFRPFYRDVTFHGVTGCIVGQNGCVLISNDGGASWRPTATFFEPTIREFLDLTSVQFVSEQKGYAVGELGTRILTTEDGGISWSLRPIDNTDWLRAVWGDEQGNLVVVGEREKIIKSIDNGITWNTLRGNSPQTDIMVLLAHGDDAAINLGAFFAHFAINQNKQIVDIEVLRDAHSVEYKGEIYNMEHHRDIRMSGVRTTTYFDEFENGNNGCDYYHFTERLWEGEENVTRHLVAAIRAYRPEIIIIHGPVFGDYDKPGHKLSGRAGIPAFETSGGDIDHWQQLTRLSLKPWQAKKIYCLASESFPITLDLAPISDITLKGTDGTCWDWAEFVIRNFQSQGVYHAREGKLCLIKSLVDVPEKESSVFDGLE